MDLTNEDKEFLEEVGKQLELPPWEDADAAAACELYDELTPIMDRFRQEAGEFAVGLVRTVPNMDILMMLDPKALAAFAQLMFAHGFIKAWQTRDYNDQT